MKILKSLTIVVLLVYLSSTANAANLFTVGCYIGPPPVGLDGPTPTHVMLHTSVIPIFGGMTVLIDVDWSPAPTGVPQGEVGQSSINSIPHIFTWKINVATGQYEADWNVTAFYTVDTIIGPITVPMGVDECIEPSGGITIPKYPI